MLRLKSMQHHRRTSHDGQRKRLIITRSADDFPRLSIEPPLKGSKSAQPLPQFSSTAALQRTTNSDPSLIRIVKIPSIFKSESSNDQPGIIPMSQQPLPMIAVRPLEKSYSSPLPMNQNRSACHEQDMIHSAHLIEPYSNEQTKSTATLISSGGTTTTETSSSNDESQTERSLLKNQNHLEEMSLRHRWSFVDLWRNTLTKIPSMWNCVWKQQVHRTGSREFRSLDFTLSMSIVDESILVLEYDQTAPLSSHGHNNSSHGKIFRREERYVEQERPIDSHVGLAILALMIFPPVGKLAALFTNPGSWICREHDSQNARRWSSRTLKKKCHISLKALLSITPLFKMKLNFSPNDEPLE